MSRAKVDNSPELSDREIKVLNLFIEGMSRRKAYRTVFNEFEITDTPIYEWFRKEKVVKYLKEYEEQLQNYNVVCDKVLLDIVTSDYAKDKDKIAAIKAWNELKNRVKPTIKVENQHSFDLSGLADEELEKIINITNNESK